MAEKKFTGVKLYVDWNMASSRENILTGKEVNGVAGEALATSLGKIAKWFNDIPSGLFDNPKFTDTNTTYTFVSGTTGSFKVTPSVNGVAGTEQTVTVYTHPTTAGNKHIPTGGSSGQILAYSASGTAAWTTPQWVTKAVDNLDNYYTKTEINDLILPKLKFEVVTTRPTTGTENVIYLVPIASATGENIYTEWMYINSKWEKLGDLDADFSGYVTAANIKAGTTAGTLSVQGTGESAKTITIVQTESTVANDAKLPTGAAVKSFVEGKGYVTSSGVTSVNGTANNIVVTNGSSASPTVNLAEVSGVSSAAGTTYGPSQTAATTASNGTKIKVPKIAVDKYGRVTSISEIEFTAQNTNTNTYVTQNIATVSGTTEKNFPLLLSAYEKGVTTTTATTVNRNDGAYLNLAYSEDKVIATLYSDVFVGWFSGNTLTQAANDNSTKLASTEYVDRAVGSITDSDKNVTQTNTTTSAAYRVLLSNSANDTTTTEGARKSSKLTFNPSTGVLTATKFVGDGSGLTDVSVAAANVTGLDAAIGTAGYTKNTGTVTSITASADGMTGGTITGSGTIGLNLKSTTKLNIDSVAAVTTGTTNKVYPVLLDKSGKLSVNVPWTDNNTVYTHPTYTAQTGKPTANATPGFGATFTISQITSDATGHVTGAVDRTVKIPNTVVSATAAGLVGAPTTSNANKYYKANASGVPGWTGSPVEEGDELVLHCVA